MKKLKSLQEFLFEIEKYAEESQNYQRVSALIFEYNNWLNQDIDEKMFSPLQINPLFPGFTNCTQSEAVKLSKEKSYCKFGKDEWQITVCRMSGKEYGMDEEMRFITSFHLKTINDVVGKIEEYNNTNKEFGHTDFSDF